MKRKFALLLSFFAFAVAFSANYFLLPFDGYYWDVVLSNMKPLFTPEEGVITEIFDPVTFEIALKKPVSKTVKISLIGLTLSLFNNSEKEEALQFVGSHLKGKTVFLSYDWQGKNENGIVPAYLWLPVVKPGKYYYVLWNLVMIMNGYAALSEISFRTDYLAIFQDLYLMAMENKLGLLKNWDTEKPIGWDEIPKEYQSTLRNLFFRAIEKKETAGIQEEWIFVKAFTGELYEESAYYYSRESQVQTQEATDGSSSYLYTSSESRYRSKTYSVEIDTDQWKVEWKILPHNWQYVPDSFQIRVTDNTDWSEVAAFVTDKVTGEFTEGSKTINRRGKFTLEVAGPNPYLVIISKKNPNY